MTSGEGSREGIGTTAGVISSLILSFFLRRSLSVMLAVLRGALTDGKVNGFRDMCVKDLVSLSGRRMFTLFAGSQCSSEDALWGDS